MSTSQARYYPGNPAVLCRSIPTTVCLQELANILSPSQPYLVWLDSARVHRRTGRVSVLGWDPWLAYSFSESAPHAPVSSGAGPAPLEALRQIASGYSAPRGLGLPAVGLGLFVVLGYELNAWIERLPPPKPSPVRAPLVSMLGMRMLVVVDHGQERTWCLSLVDPAEPPALGRRHARMRLEMLESLLAACRSSQPDALIEPPLAGPAGSAGSVEPTIRQAEFEAMVRAAKEAITAGEIFQANLAHQFTAPLSAEPWQLYAALRAINPSPFACYYQSPELTLVSCSPERLVEVRDGLVSTRPIAGTRPRGPSPAQDLLNGIELMLSEKERAEHLMLVDLARNDLGRVCRFGSVEVDELMTLEEYSHVLHLVSNVRGWLREGVDQAEVIRALFPGGTITGCPKVRAMELIHALEPIARGPYTGSAGMVGFDGSLDLNILIRTVVVQRDRVWFHVGAGIVADSDPEREYHETLAKAGALIKALAASYKSSTNDQASITK